MVILLMKSKVEKSVVMSLVLVEVCSSNLLSTLPLEDLFENEMEVAVMRYECLNLCGLCKMRPYALVNGDRVFGKTLDDCVDNIKVKIEQELEEFFR
ncbi:DUF1450 domain-containing protein [Sutcliffiella cohnii]|nr:DUF1450 domain-containing protein [Sutcliffiella cohnii]MED4018012.1 DUF1450 domain-containing protein [Sutcliffiella cohnii]